jgi:TonB family protein
MPPAPSRRLLLALALSLGVHALVWLVLAARADRLEQPPPSPKPITLEYVEVEIPRSPAAKPPEPPPIPAPPRPRPAPKPVAEAKPPPPPAAPPPEATVQAPTTDIPRADMPLAADAPRAPGLRLTPPLSLTPAGEIPVAPQKPSGVQGLEAQSAQQIVSNLALETTGKGKVERGLVHPYFTQLGKSLLKVWDAERAVSSQGFKGFLDERKENSKAWNSIWLEHAAAYGSSGSLLGSDAPARNSRRPLGRGDPNLEARQQMRRQMREEFRATKRAVIRVVQDAQGKLLEVTLVSPSNNVQVDKEAMKDVRAAAEQLPPPPAEALAGKQTLTSLWQFELIVSITPPVPSISFEFDEALSFIDTRLPLDRRIYKRVRLLSVRA